MASLLDGRNTAPLTDEEVRRALNIFLGLDGGVSVKYEPTAFTRFVVADAGGDVYGEVVFSNDLYPGQNVANPNSILGIKAAAAHELAHYYRWRDKRELNGESLRHLDEALTSLEAAQVFAKALSDIEVQQLIADACERLRRHIQATIAAG